SSHDLSDDIDPKATGSKLALLTLHFPRLRLVWSRSLHATADLFAALKSNMDEPDPATAQAIGLPQGRDAAYSRQSRQDSIPTSSSVLSPIMTVTTELRARGRDRGGGHDEAAAGSGHAASGAAPATVVNQLALDVLRRLPGVNDANYRTISSRVSSLMELAQLPLQQLEAVMGGARAAKQLHDFLHAPCPRAGM
ncbi:hypothetical protein V8C86DRAFT_3093071, partial [Haematococcus lacustris]